MTAAFDFQRPRKNKYGSLSTTLAFQSGPEFTIRRRPYIDDSDWVHKLMAEAPPAQEASIPDALAKEFIVECEPGAQSFVARIFSDQHIVGLLQKSLGDELDSVGVARDGAWVWRKLKDSILIYGDMNRLEEMARLAFELLTRIHRAISPAR